jgi:hypothetical protein
MGAISFIPFFKEIKLSQKFDIERIYFGSVSKLVQHTHSILSIAKVFKKLWIENLSCSIGDDLSVNIVRGDLNVDWKFENCNHKLYFRITAFVLKDSSGEENDFPSAPVFYTRVEKERRIFLC